MFQFKLILLVISDYCVVFYCITNKLDNKLHLGCGLILTIYCYAEMEHNLY